MGAQRTVRCDLSYTFLFLAHRFKAVFTKSNRKEAEDLLKSYLHSQGVNCVSVACEEYAVLLQVEPTETQSAKDIASIFRRSSQLFVKSFKEMAAMQHVWRAGFYVSSQTPSRQDLLAYMAAEKYGNEEEE